jgi:hypothetical protein
MENLNDIIQGYISEIQLFFAKYGWYIVFTLLALHFSWPSIEKFMKQRSLSQANNPIRRKILDEERKRVRMYQQLDVYKASKEAKAKN